MGKWLSGLLALTFMIVLGSMMIEKTYSSAARITYGVTFSPRYARYLKLDWQKTYLQILDDLQVRNLRILTYWDISQPQPEKYNFVEIDYLLNEANKRDARVVLVLGARQPRWPECQIPSWAKNLSVSSRQQKALEFIANTVQRYKTHPEIWAWQVENEPFVSWFGQNCDPPDEKFLQQEVKVVKQLDPARPVIITDSGEWSNWISAMKSGDILGVSVYKKAYNQLLNSYITYPFPAWMYPLKSTLVRKLFASQNQETIVSELQTEPWFQKGVLDMPVIKQSVLFTAEDLRVNVEYAKKTGMSEQYFWGVEWWYFMKAHGYPQYLDYARTLFK